MLPCVMSKATVLVWSGQWHCSTNAVAFAFAFALMTCLSWDASTRTRGLSFSLGHLTRMR